ncbi:Lin1244/Lin1753 domain-containing protein [Bacillus infantis]|uniref:Lin1244/Lin1753 domain-containing protein n=1 Tax=Bacillus infantis TaxID=324767 RepID=UPI003CF9C8DE
MARPKKQGLDYFPLDVDIDQDDKIALIEAKYGAEGFAIVIKLLMRIYKNSYFYKWTEIEQLLFSKRVNVDINQVNVCINDAVKWGLFDSDLYEKHQILTSTGIQKRYLEAVGRRQKAEMVREYLLLDVKEVIAYKNITLKSINVDINSVNADINPQSKVKESKVKESKEEESAATENPVTFFESNLGRLSPIQMQEMWEWSEDFNGQNEILIHAMKIALDRNKKNMGFVKYLLKNWQDRGAKTLNDVQALETEWNGGKQNEPPKQHSELTQKYDFGF